MIAIFTLVILSGLATALLQIVTRNAQGIAYETYNVRAYWAAKSGLENELYRLEPAAGIAATCRADPRIYNLNALLGTSSGFEGCQAEVTCRSFAAVGLEDPVIQITSTGSCRSGGNGPSQNQVFTAQRVLVAER